MKIHIRQMPHGTGHFSGEVDASGFELEKAEAKALGPVFYEVDAGLSDGGLWVAGSLRLTVELRCVRTLELFPYQLEISDFAAQVQLDGRECVDLTNEVREDILLNLPPYPKKDDADIAPLQETPKSPQDGAAREVDPPATPSVWSVLDELDSTNKDN
jgi:uncharacterized protein